MHSNTASLEHSPHSVSLAGVLGILLILTAITVIVSRLEVTPTVHITVAMLVASAKALLVSLYFMHLRYEKPLIWLYVVLPIILLIIMIAGVFLDNPFRAEVLPVSVVN